MAAYSVSYANGTIVVSAALAFVNPAASPSASLKFLRAWVGQSSTATSAQLNVKVFSKVSVFPTLTSATPEPMHRTGRASVITGGTAGAAGTAGTLASVAGAGAETTIIGDVFNNLNGYLYVPSYADAIVFDAGSSSGFGYSITSTPSALTGFSGGVIFDEV